MMAVRALANDLVQLAQMMKRIVNKVLTPQINGDIRMAIRVCVGAPKVNPDGWVMVFRAMPAMAQAAEGEDRVPSGLGFSAGEAMVKLGTFLG